MRISNAGRGAEEALMGVQPLAIVMNPGSAPEITELLQEWSAGDQSAVGQINELVYPKLHRMAKKHLYHTSGPTRQSFLWGLHLMRLTSNQ